MDKSVSERIRRRRQILKAGAGVPVVFMLPNGSALAASSAGACEYDGESVQSIEDVGEFLSNFNEGSQPTHLDTIEVGGRTYVYDENGRRLVTASCWSSIDPAHASVVATTRIV